MAFCTWQSSEPYKDHFKPGIYVCAECGHELFSSRCKYEHHTPWPAFTEPIHNNSLTKVREVGRPLALKVSCGKCGSGLGHEFKKEREDGGSRF